MSIKRRKLIETIRGSGKVHRDNVEIAGVRYSIEIFQEYIVTRTLDGESEIEGLREIVGQLKVLDGERNLITGEVLTLKLSDGRRWSFFANRGDPVSGSYTAVNAAGGDLLEDDS